MKEKLRTLYESGALSAEGLLNAVIKGWVTVGDAVEIIGEGNAVEVVKSAKLAEISKACNSTIVGGIDLELNGETVHFNLSNEDQNNISNLFKVVELGGSEYPYQSDGGVCRIYTASEIAQIYLAAQTHITTQTTYHNALKSYVQSLTEVDKIAAVSYGMVLPKAYQTEMAEKLSIAETQMNAIVARLNQAVTDNAA